MFCFNFHPVTSYTDYKIGIDNSGEYKIELDSDWLEFGGHERRNRNQHHFTFPVEHDRKKYHFKTYLPNRTAVVFKMIED